MAITGVGSGIDIDSIVSALVSAEKAPKQNQLDTLLKTTESKISALGTLYSAVNTFNTALGGLNSASSFQKQSVSSSSSSVVSATADSTVAAGKFSLQVQQLATSSKVVLASVTGSGTGDSATPSTAATFSSGSLVISGGKSSFTVNVSAQNNNLTAIRDAINTAGTEQGVSASIVTDSSGSRLVLNSTNTGAGNDLTVSVSEDGVTAAQNSLSALSFAGGKSVSQLPVVANPDTSTFKQGSLTIASGDVSLDISVDAEDDLTAILGKINAQGSAQGISASLVEVEGGSRLVVSSSAGESLSVTGTSDSGSAGSLSLSQLSSVAGSNSKTITQAKSALFTVDGLSVERQSNSVEGVVDGLTINLNAAQSADDIAAGKTIDIAVAQDKNTVKTSLQSFVSAYNALISATDGLTVVVASSQAGGAPVTGALVGDASIRNLLSGIRKQLSGGTGSNDGISSLAQLGVTTQKDGTLSLDSTKLDKVLSTDYEAVSAFMTGDNGLVSRLSKVTSSYLGDGGVIKQRDSALWATKSNITKQQEKLDLRIESLQTRLYAQYNAMDSLVAQLQSTSTSLTSMLASLPGAVKKSS